MKHKKKYAVITGGTSGIGYELAKLLAADGYNLVIVARTESDLEEVANEIKQRFVVDVITISKDLFDVKNAFKLYDEVRSHDLQVDILINDAGQGQYGEFTDTDILRELDIINLNISSLVVLTKLFLQDMISHGSGKIMNVSSIASKVPGPWQSVYHGTKAFVQSFTQAVNSEVKDKGVTVTALLPGATDTDFFNKADMESSKGIQDKSKLSDPADVAKDGYEALMANKDMVISGIGNKISVAMNAITSDEKATEKMAKMQEPVDKK